MFNTSALCRQQEAHHRRISAETDLQNVRKVALAAARAWEVQALEAESREAGAKDALSGEDAAIALGFLLEDEADAEDADDRRSEEHTSELQSLMRISYAVFCLKKKKKTQNIEMTTQS